MPLGSTGFETQTETGDATSDGTGNSTAIYGGPGVDPDGGGVTIECSVWSQDCAAGQKCMPWANDGGDVWNAARCVLLTEDPAPAGEPCTAMDTFTSGFDTCDVGLICLGSDVETLEGICGELCGGSADKPICDETQDATCVGVDGVIPLCRPICDPLNNDCTEGETCVPSFDDWGCMPVGRDPAGEPCELVNACEQGLICLAEGGCSVLCDLLAPLPEASCLDDEVCTPLYEEGTAPDGHDDVGVCGPPD